MVAFDVGQLIALLFEFVGCDQKRGERVSSHLPPNSPDFPPDSPDFKLMENTAKLKALQLRKPFDRPSSD